MARSSRRPPWATGPAPGGHVVYDRLGHVEDRWELKCMRNKQGRPRYHVSEPRGALGFRVRVVAPELQEATRFLERLRNEPGFWRLVHRRIAAGHGPHHRGNRYAKRRAASIELWIRLLVRGRLEAGDLHTSALEARAVKAMLKARADRHGWHVLDGHLGSAYRTTGDGRRREVQPFAVAGPLDGDETAEFRRHHEAGDDGKPASGLRRGILETLSDWSWGLCPEYIEDLLRAQELAARLLLSERWDATERADAERLLGDLGASWWLLPHIHRFAFLDAALDWWHSQPREAQKRLLQEPAHLPWGPRRARAVADALRRPRHFGPAASPDETGLHLLDAAGRLPEAAALVALQRMLLVPGASGAVKAAAALDAAILQARLGSKTRAKRWLARAKAHARGSRSLKGRLAAVDASSLSPADWLAPRDIDPHYRRLIAT